MTIQEIRDLVAKKIMGQGTMVDVGGGLPAILNGILDLIAAVAQSIAVPTLTAEESELDNRIKITPDRYAELISSTIIKGHNGEIFTLCTAVITGELESFFADYEGNALFFKDYALGNDGVMSSCSGFFVGRNTNDSDYYFVPINI